MEIYSDSRCRIYIKNQPRGKKQIEWKLIHQIKKYPTVLQGSTLSNFLFSPNLNYFIDVAVIRNQFCIRSCATNEIVLFIPKGLYGFKTSDVAEQGIRMLASRMYFEEENRIRILNPGGLDTIMELNFETKNKKGQDTVIIKSVCKIDHFDDKLVEKHFFFDKDVLEMEHTLQRLVRTN